MAAAPEPFEIHVDDAVLDDLRARLDATRWPDEVGGAGWEMGSNLAYMKELAAYWRDEFDWREQERRLNALPQFKAEVDGLGIHFVHIEGKGPDPFPLIVSHGWPGSFFEMHKIAGPLTDPAAHGGDPADAFHLVVPSADRLRLLRRLPRAGDDHPPHGRALRQPHDRHAGLRPVSARRAATGERR